MANDKPIGVFDSGLGGLTVARAIASALPEESLYYIGDTARCPYGEKPQEEVRGYVAQISRWLQAREIKLLVIACNTATAAGLDVAQRMLDIPVLGVIVPGARAVVQATHSRHVGVLATQGTVDSGSYVRAIKNLDAGVEVWQAPSPRSVTVVEETLAAPVAMNRDWMSSKDVFEREEVDVIAREDIRPLEGHGIDAVILGCTHFPLLKPAYQKAFGPDVTIVSSAEETAREVEEYLVRNGSRAGAGHVPQYRFATTSSDLAAFAVAGSFVFGRPLESIEHVDIDHLETLAPARID